MGQLGSLDKYQYILNNQKEAHLLPLLLYNVCVKRKFLSVLLLGTLVLGGITLLRGNKISSTPEITDENSYFYPAYATDAYNEPKYKTGITTSRGTYTQKSQTYDRMNVSTTWNSYRGDNVRVAVIDTGILSSHEDFSGTNISPRSYNVYSSSTNITDAHGHGTDSAACIAAAINSVGGLGMSPNVELIVYKASDASHGFSASSLNKAIRRAIADHVDVINMSVQGYAFAFNYSYVEDYDGETYSGTLNNILSSTALQGAINEAHDAGITIVAAAGNYNTTYKSYPAANEHVIAVGSTSLTSATSKAGFSNGGDWVDVVAPGYVVVPSISSNSSYQLWWGTSFSAPLVSGAIALYKSKYPSATPDEIEARLKATCSEVDYSGAGAGQVDVANFLNNGAAETWIHPTSMSIPSTLNVDVGDTTQIETEFTPSNTTRQTCYWSSSSTSVATVDAFGNVKGVKAGTATITATSVDEEISRTCTVTVNNVSVTGVTLNKHQLTMDTNSEDSLSATVSPNNATNKKVTYSSSNENIVVVDDSGNLLTGDTEGNAIITVTTDEGGFTDTCEVTVGTPSTISPTSITISSDGNELNVGNSMQFTATVLPNNATDKSVTWSSSNTEVATINQSGLLTGLKDGTTTVTATTNTGGLTHSKTITVHKVLSSISIDGQTTEFTVGNTFDFGGTVTAHYNDSSTSDVTSSATFSGYDMNTAGEQTVTVSYGGKSAQYTITVSEATSYTVSSTPLTSSNIKNNMLVAWGTSNTNLAYTIESDWVKLTTDSDDWIFFTLKGTSEGFTLEYEGDSVYSSASKKVTFSSTQSTTMTLNASNVVTGNSVGKYVFNTTGLRPYSSGTYTNSYLYEVTSSSDTPSPTLESITINGYTTSFVEGDTFSFGGTVTAHYSDSTTENVTSSAAFSGYNMTSTGQQEVTVSYSNQSANYNITVNQGTLSSISISGYTTSYSKGATFSFDGTLTATMANGYQKVLTPTSVTSPDMSAAGVETITISLTYNGKTLSTTYDITINSQRTVIEEGYSVIGTVTYTSGSESISVNTLSTSKSGYTNIENGPDASHKAIRLGSGSNKGTLTITSTTSNIRKVVVNARTYNTDSPVSLTIGGTSNSLTTSYADYTKEYASGTNSVAIATTTNGKRAWISSVIVYTYSSQDISKTEDCIGLESFITEYMHMDYTSNLGYCKDSEHHYYTSAKSAFNSLNTHQRTLFTSNSAYALEWARLSAWATANGESLNSSNQLSASNKMRLLSGINNNFVSIIVFVSLTSLTLFGAFKAYRKKDD